MFVLISPWNWGWPFNWSNLNPLYPGWFVLSFVEIGLGTLGKNIFLNIFNWIIYFCYYLPLEKGVALQMNKLEPPLPKDDLGQVWSKLALCYWRRKLLNVCNRILHLCYYLHLEKGMALLLHKFESHLLKNDLCQVKFGLNWPSVTGKEDFWIFAIEFIFPWKTV